MRSKRHLSVGQVYLKDNPRLLDIPLTHDHGDCCRLLVHWGTTPGLNFLYVHLNRLIKQNDLNMMYVIGPGHGGPGIVANTYLEGSYTERYPGDRGAAEMHSTASFACLSWLYGIPSHVSPGNAPRLHP